MMRTLIEASPKVATRIRSIPLQTSRPLVEEVISYAATCPHCTREARVSLGERATVRGIIRDSQAYRGLDASPAIWARAVIAKLEKGEKT